jgi:hypothetical protein
VDALQGLTRLPKVVRDLGLMDSVGGEARVGPAGRAVTVEFGPVALPLSSVFVHIKKKEKGNSGITFQAGVP